MAWSKTANVHVRGEYVPEDVRDNSVEFETLALSEERTSVD